MRTGARSRIGRTPIVMRFVSGIFLVACLTAQGSRTHADELPQHACALKMPFAMFEEMVSEELQRMLEGIDPDIALHVLGIQITPVLGGLRYETVTWQTNPADPNSIASALVPRRVPAGERINDPGTSNDDYLEVKISLSALSIFHPAIKVAIAIPQDRPPGVDHDAGKTCTCRTWDHDELEPIAALPPCPPELPQTDPRYQERLHYRQINCDWIMGREVDFIDYPRPPEETWEGAGLHQYIDDLSSNSSFYYGSCTKIWHDRCDLLSAEEFLRFHEVTGLTNTDLTSHGCVGCLTEIWNEEDMERGRCGH